MHSNKGSSSHRMEKRIVVGNDVLCYLQNEIADENDRTHALNIIKIFNAAVTKSSNVCIEFCISYDALQPTYFIDFFTEHREITLTSLRPVLDNRQVLQLWLHPSDVYSRGYVRIQSQKAQHSSKKRKLSSSWKLKGVKLDGIPEMGKWATDIDRDIARQLLEFTYGMYEDMPIITVSILQDGVSGYDILCNSIPEIDYRFLLAIKKHFPTYVQQIAVDVEGCCMRYNLRLNNSHFDSASSITDYDSDSANCRPHKRPKY